MTFDIDKIIESKKRLRSELAALPIEVKLAMLDDLRERAISLIEAHPLKRQTNQSEEPMRA